MNYDLHCLTIHTTSGEIREHLVLGSIGSPAYRCLLSRFIALTKNPEAEETAEVVMSVIVRNTDGETLLVHILEHWKAEEEKASRIPDQLRRHTLLADQIDQREAVPAARPAASPNPQGPPKGFPQKPAAHYAIPSLLEAPNVR